MNKKKRLLFPIIIFNCVLFVVIRICLVKDTKHTEKEEKTPLSLIMYEEYGKIQDIDETNKIVKVMVDDKKDSVFDQKEQYLHCEEKINMEFLEVGKRISFSFTNYDLDENKVFVNSIDLPSDTKNLINYPAVEADIMVVEADRIIVKEDSGRSEEVTILKDELDEFLDIESLAVGDRIKIFHNGQIMKGKYGTIKEIIILDQ